MGGPEPVDFWSCTAGGLQVEERFAALCSPFSGGGLLKVLSEGSLSGGEPLE